MGGFSTLVGATFGLSTGLFSNGLRKVALFRKPYMHALYVGLGAYAGYKYPAVYHQQLMNFNEMRMDRGLAPVDRIGGLDWGKRVDGQ